MKIKDISYDIKIRHTYTRYVTSRKKRSGRNCGHNCQFYIVFFEDCEIFFRTLGPLCTCPSIRTGCIDWFRNHPRVKQIYRIIVKKKSMSDKTALSKQQTTHLSSDRAQFCNHGLPYCVPGKELSRLNFCRKSF